MADAASARPIPRGSHGVRFLHEGWELAAAAEVMTEVAATDRLEWASARVPGTVAGALGRDAFGPAASWRDPDAEDWWYRTSFEAAPAASGEEVLLRFDGLASVATVYLNGRVVLESESMFVAHSLDVGDQLRGGCNELAIRFHALAPLLLPKRRPRARWRTKVVANGNLRFFRTSLFGRAPGFAPGPAAVGPWRTISLERRRGVVVEGLRLRTRVVGDQGVLTACGQIRTLEEPTPASVEIQLKGPSGNHRGTLQIVGGPDPVFSGELAVASIARWWPHTHGDPVLHEVSLLIEHGGEEIEVAAGKVGFRSLAAVPDAGHTVSEHGLDIQVNGVAVFARGAVWTPVDPLGLAPTESELRKALEDARDAGMNMVRVPGTSAYESDCFHDLCDELGILVWQDFMFANLDYPISDDAFRALVVLEAEQLLARVAGRPSLAVLCGNSEVEQQVAMLGLDPALARGELFDELLPSIAAQAEIDAVYLPSAPSGGLLPFRFDRGVSNYFGVGGYRRPLEDVRRAGIRFASECLAISNVPSYDPGWKEGVPRDVDSNWDFEDVRDYYLNLLYGVDPVEMRRVDPGRYLEFSRVVSGEVMAEVFGEWRREGSVCKGGLVLWMRDLEPGSGWGLVDHLGIPKVAYHQLRRVLAPIAVWTTDEGLAGVAIHVANDAPVALAARLRVSLYRDLEHRVEEASEDFVLPAHSGGTWDVEGLVGRFVDASWAYRFGPPNHDLIVASLERESGDGHELLSQAMRFPVGRPTMVQDVATLGLEGTVRWDGDGLLLEVETRRLAYGVRVQATGFVADDDAFAVEPGGKRAVRLRTRGSRAAETTITLSALNLEGTVRINPTAGF